MTIHFKDFTEGQQKAVKVVNDCLNMIGKPGAKHVVIAGAAGTGKTTITKYLIRSIRNRGIRGIILTAPTHQAKKVLSKLSGTNASTIQSVLKIKPDTYEDIQEFKQSDVPDLSKCKVLFCDEASMFDKQLLDILLSSVPPDCLIIALGDIEQVRSANSRELSPIFRDNRFTKVELTEVKRAGGPILELASKIRSLGWEGSIKQESITSDDTNVFRCESATELVKKYLEYVKTPEDFKENRLLCYTNKLVESCNLAIRRRIYGKDVEYFTDGEILVMQEPVVKEIKVDGEVKEETVFNNSEWVKVNSLAYTSEFISLPGVAGKIMIRFWALNLVSEEDPDKQAIVKVLSEQSEKDKLQDLLSKAANIYKDRSSGKRPSWKEFWKLKAKFKSVKHLPACTIHKSQGSSIDNTFIFSSEIDAAWHLDEIEKKELLYTAFTRARKNVYFY